MKHNTFAMDRSFSLYLDFIRFSAAMLVFFSHVPSFAGGWLWQLAGFGHQAVVVFFVLSGFVISYVVYDKKESSTEFTVNRMSRIYSVACPALILTLILYYMGVFINAHSFNTLNLKLLDPIWTIFAALTFTNQSWIPTTIFSNLPYWSLGYEVLYYVFFGVLVYCSGVRRIVLLLVLLMIMGPSIILYLPIWFAGVYCFKSLHKFEVGLNASIFTYMLSLIGIGLLCIGSIKNSIDAAVKPLIGDRFYSLLLEPAEQFFSDYFLMIFVTLHIFGSYHLIRNSKFFQLSDFWERNIKNLSSHTFSLYLFHMPILYFASAVFPYAEYSIFNLISCWIITPLLVFLTSRYTESKKQKYKLFFGRLVNFYSDKKVRYR